MEVFLLAMKLGEMLVREGKITSAELEETLKGQAIFGGRFGTNLVEMGLLDELELTQFLSKKTGVPHASSEQLMNIPPQVIKLLPEDSVKKHRVVPVAVNNKKLFLAMTDPWDLAAIDEIAFVTGYIVMPLITPELRLVCALEKYYNIKRDLRYIPVAGGGRARARTGPAAASPPAAPKPAAAAPPPFVPEDEIFELPELDELDCFGDLSETENQALVPASFSGLGGARREAEKDYSMDAVLRGLTQASDRDHIAQLIVGYTSRQFPRSALFLVKGDRATGWVAQLGAKPPADFEALSVGLNEPSVLKTVAESKACHLGRTPISPCNSRILAALGGGDSANQLLAPLLMMGRVVAILYVDGGSGRLDDRIDELQKLLAKGSMAFEILILKNKILLT